jgi:hypothetical protein
MLYWTLSLWYIDPSTYGISKPLPMVFRFLYPLYFEPLIHSILTPYPWYIEPNFHGILTPISMVFWLPYPGNIETPIHVILTLYSWNVKPTIYSISDPLPMTYSTLTHGILNTLSMAYRTSYP